MLVHVPPTFSRNQVCEWVPNGESVALVGDFNDWNETSHLCTKDSFGKFRLTVPAKNGKPTVSHGSKVSRTCGTMQSFGGGGPILYSIVCPICNVCNIYFSLYISRK